MNNLGPGRRFFAWMCILACFIGMVSRRGLGDDTSVGHDDWPKHHGVLSLKNASLNFGTLTVGDSRVLTDTLGNNSGSNVVIKRATIRDGNFKVDLPLPITDSGHLTMA